MAARAAARIERIATDRKTMRRYRVLVDALRDGRASVHDGQSAHGGERGWRAFAAHYLWVRGDAIEELVVYACLECASCGHVVVKDARTRQAEFAVAQASGLCSADNYQAWWICPQCGTTNNRQVSVTRDSNVSGKRTCDPIRETLGRRRSLLARLFRF
jgi:hypothetical protein